jgi:alpha-galactosidase
MIIKRNIDLNPESRVSPSIFRRSKAPFALVLASAMSLICPLGAQQARLAVSVDSHGAYVLGAPKNPTLISNVAAKINGKWVHAADYPKHEIEKSNAEGFLGGAEQWRVVFSGLTGAPDLIYRLRAYTDEPFVDLEVTIRNNTGAPITVESIRPIEASGESVVNLDGPASADRVLSDSFSEDRPEMKIHDLPDAGQPMLRAVGSQLIYNRESHESLFVGALTSERFLTILRLHLSGSGDESRIARYEIDSTGTTEMELENSLERSPEVDRVELSLPVPAGSELSSETLAISAGKDYHHQLETYGSLIRQIHHARIAAPSLMGWWSWTAFYFGLNEGAALTNAAWEAQHIKRFGYDVFHIDEGYQFARGEYTTPDAVLFPNGLAPLESKVSALGLTPGIWTAPFNVSDRSYVFQQHSDWLVKNAQGQPIHSGFVVNKKDPLYTLDTTNPGAQEYLRTTYRKLAHEWGIRYIKMDFMDDSAIEGYYYKPHTTAMEAQRIGLQIIRDAVGDDVYLDKDGSVMLNPVGLVDFGRISQDTGHNFVESRDAATGIAARYYMQRNFYVSDPDAFTVSSQMIRDQPWPDGKGRLSLSEAKVSIALSAVSGGMMEIGDNLPSLQNSDDRLALIENRDLIDMTHLGKASTPLDLMDYEASDRQPSVFYLRESSRQSILTVFNWTEKPLSKSVHLSDLGLDASHKYVVTDVLDHKELDSSSGSLSLDRPEHSVHVLKIVDSTLPAAAPEINVRCPASSNAGAEATFSAQADAANPALVYRWDFGDGVQADGAQVAHTWTEAGDYEVHLTATGLDDFQAEKSCRVHVTGHLPTVFTPSAKKRYESK